MPARTKSRQCRPSIASMSLGRAAYHSLQHKLDMAVKYGFEGIELFYEDLETYAQHHCHGSKPEDLLQAAKDVRSLCTARKLEIVCLQPFMHYEGLRDREEHARRIEELRLWCKIAHILETDIIGLPSSFLPKSQITGDFDVLVSDLREVAQVAAEVKPPIRLAYEALAWGTHVDTWEKAWPLVEAVDEVNFGLCLDTFNMAGRIYADPAVPTGKTVDADIEVTASCKRLASLVNIEKVFFVQVVDGARLKDGPLVEGHKWFDPSQPARMSWSRNARLFYGEKEQGAYLPITEILHTYLHELGYRGWLSQELFNIEMSNESPDTPERLAARAEEAWRKMREDLQIPALHTI